MPVLQLPSVPAKYAGEQLKYLLHRSEFFFPPLNAVCTVGNLVAAVACYLHRGTSRFAAAKLPYAAAAFALCAATTAYALGIMVPINRRLGALATKLKTNDADEESEKELRALQQKWRKLNYGQYSCRSGHGKGDQADRCDHCRSCFSDARLVRRSRLRLCAGRQHAARLSLGFAGGASTS